MPQRTRGTCLDQEADRNEMSGTRQKNDILQGTLALLVLKTLADNGRLHGYAITAHIQRVSEEMLRVEEGSLYPGLHRMAQDGWLKAEWGVTEKNRQARFYTITRAGRQQLALEEESWARLRAGVQRVLGYA
jgi:PadR family transcriptional regulator